MTEREVQNETSPPKTISASGRGRCRAARRVADREGASLSVAADPARGSISAGWRQAPVRPASFMARGGGCRTFSRRPHHGHCRALPPKDRGLSYGSRGEWRAFADQLDLSNDRTRVRAVARRLEPAGLERQGARNIGAWRFPWLDMPALISGSSFVQSARIL